MKIYPKSYEIPTEKAAPIANDPAAVAAVRARVKALLASMNKGADMDHFVSILGNEGLLSGIVDIYAVLSDGGSDWQVPIAAVEPEPKIVEK